MHLPKLPIHIECFDNSNIQGSDAVAACVVFKMAKPSKKDYRKYIIKTVVGPDDYASCLLYTAIKPARSSYENRKTSGCKTFYKISGHWINKRK